MTESEAKRIEHVTSCIVVVYQARNHEQAWIDSWIKTWMPWIVTLALEYPKARVAWILKEIVQLDAALARWIVENRK